MRQTTLRNVWGWPAKLALMLAVAVGVPYLGAVMDLVGGTVYLGLGLLPRLISHSEDTTGGMWSGAKPS